MLKEKQSLITLILTVVMLLVLVIGASFAYFSASVNVTANTLVDVKAPNREVFTVASVTNVGINVTNDKMLTTATSAAGATNSTLYSQASLSISYSAANASGSKCTYNIILTRTSSSAYSASTYYTNNSSTYPYEFSIQVTPSTWRGSGSAVSLAQTNIDKLNWSGTTATLISGANIRSTASVIQDWTIIFRAYNLPGNQDNLAGLNWSGTISVSNVQCGLAY